MKAQKGFSLLELLVAIAILSAGILVVLQAAGRCARITGITKDTLSALLLAEDKLQELQYKERSAQITETRGSGTSGKYAWNYDLEFNSSLNLYQCGLSISWESAGRDEKLTVNTFLTK